MTREETIRVTRVLGEETLKVRRRKIPGVEVKKVTGPIRCRHDARGIPLCRLDERATLGFRSILSDPLAWSKTVDRQRCQTSRNSMSHVGQVMPMSCGDFWSRQACGR